MSTRGEVSVRMRSLCDFAGGDFGYLDTRHNCVGEFHNGPVADYEVEVMAKEACRAGERGHFLVRTSYDPFEGKAP